jgi:hypothetical protein
LGYHGGKLAHLTSWLPARQAAEEMADAGGRFVERRAAELTPVGETGEARRAWRRSEVQRRRLGRDAVLSVKVSNSNYVARFLNNGTKAHEIRPDHAAALELPNGERASAHVSGIRPRKMIENAAAAAEVSMPKITGPALERWRAETERLAKRHKSIS